jgi:plasmid stabilization system protein ParE
VAQLPISPRASEDLTDIWSYIADDSEAHADENLGTDHGRRIAWNLLRCPLT